MSNRAKRAVAIVALALVVAIAAAVSGVLLWGYLVIRPGQICSSYNGYWDSETRSCLFQTCAGRPGEQKITSRDPFICQEPWKDLEARYRKDTNEL